jgi:hypothetical protein
MDTAFEAKSNGLGEIGTYFIANETQFKGLTRRV